ncbi:proteoglycan 4-like [Eriocheir sinensis]|uniref:proteoglycan 4-like n=1 Tax=Eriocheir sinensis TaxID=95602 RepID=UPI0021C9BAE9|nr:proteoglycan 4-like [Eriocheir sinensis]
MEEKSQPLHPKELEQWGAGGAQDPSAGGVADIPPPTYEETTTNAPPATTPKVMPPSTDPTDPTAPTPTATYPYPTTSAAPCPSSSTAPYPSTIHQRPHPFSTTPDPTPTPDHSTNHTTPFSTTPDPTLTPGQSTNHPTPDSSEMEKIAVDPFSQDSSGTKGHEWSAEEPVAAGGLSRQRLYMGPQKESGSSKTLKVYHKSEPAFLNGATPQFAYLESLSWKLPGFSRTVL